MIPITSRCIFIAHLVLVDIEIVVIFVRLTTYSVLYHLILCLVVFRLVSELTASGNLEFRVGLGQLSGGLGDFVLCSDGVFAQTYGINASLSPIAKR